MSQASALAARIHSSLDDLEKVVARTTNISEKAVLTGDDDYWDGVALNLHGFYSGVERVFEDIARTLDNSMPSGPDWHRSLLLQMSAELPEIRPAVVRSETRDCLEEYLAFRHVVRNVYAFNFRPKRLFELTSQLRECYVSVYQDLVTFIQFLESIK